MKELVLLTVCGPGPDLPVLSALKGCWFSNRVQEELTVVLKTVWMLTVLLRSNSLD